MASITLEHLATFAVGLANKITENFVQKEAIKSELDKKVPTTRKINNKPLSDNISLSASDVGAIAESVKGSAGGVAELDATGKVPATQLPSFVDDVLEGYLYNSKFYEDASHTTEITAESGKIYTDISTNKTYRWSGTKFVVISDTLALGETSMTAYRGDYGKVAYNHSKSQHAPVDAEANVQADWLETDQTSAAYIKNKPTIPTIEEASDADIENILNGLFK